MPSTNLEEQEVVLEELGAVHVQQRSHHLRSAFRSVDSFHEVSCGQFPSSFMRSVSIEFDVVSFDSVSCSQFQLS